METLSVRFVAYFLSALKNIALSIYGRIMGGAGLAFVNFQYALPSVKSWLMDKASGLPETAIQFLGACGVDTFMILIISAVIARAGFRTMLTSINSVQALLAAEGGS